MTFGGKPLFRGINNPEAYAEAGLSAPTGKVKLTHQQAGALAAAQDRIDARKAAQFKQTTDPEAIKTEADKAAEEVKKRARKAGGRASTILTSPLGVVSPVQSTVKTLLGS